MVISLNFLNGFLLFELAIVCVVSGLHNHHPRPPPRRPPPPPPPRPPPPNTPGTRKPTTTTSTTTPATATAEVEIELEEVVNKTTPAPTTVKPQVTPAYPYSYSYSGYPYYSSYSYYNQRQQPYGQNQYYKQAQNYNYNGYYQGKSYVAAPPVQNQPPPPPPQYPTTQYPYHNYHQPGPYAVTQPPPPGHNTHAQHGPPPNHSQHAPQPAAPYDYYPATPAPYQDQYQPAHASFQQPYQQPAPVDQYQQPPAQYQQPVDTQYQQQYQQPAPQTDYYAQPSNQQYQSYDQAAYQAPEPARQQPPPARQQSDRFRTQGASQTRRQKPTNRLPVENTQYRQDSYTSQQGYANDQTLPSPPKSLSQPRSRPAETRVVIEQAGNYREPRVEAAASRPETVVIKTLDKIQPETPIAESKYFQANEKVVNRNEPIIIRVEGAGIVKSSDYGIKTPQNEKPPGDIAYLASSETVKAEFNHPKDAKTKEKLPTENQLLEIKKKQLELLQMLQTVQKSSNRENPYLKALYDSPAAKTIQKIQETTTKKPDQCPLYKYDITDDTIEIHTEPGRCKIVIKLPKNGKGKPKLSYLARN